MAAATTAPKSNRSDQRRFPIPPHCAEAKPIARDGTHPGDHPERPRWPFVTAKHGHGGRCGGEQCDDDRAVAGGCFPEREGGQERETDDDTTGHDSQTQPLPDVRESLARDGQGERCESGRHDRAGRPDEQRGQTADRDPGERNGERERRYSKQTPEKTRGRSGRYRRRTPVLRSTDLRQSHRRSVVDRTRRGGPQRRS